jgi:hypothetical protein
MRQPTSGQILAGCAAVALLALWSTVDFYGATAAAVVPGADPYKIADQAARFQDLAPALPATGIIGYVSDVPTSETLGAVLLDGAQYALAPRLIREQRLQPGAEWVMGNFSKPLEVTQFGKERGLTLVKDFGNGVVLYKNEAR